MASDRNIPFSGALKSDNAPVFDFTDNFVVHLDNDPEELPEEKAWRAAVCKGQKLLDQMAANDRDAGHMSKEPLHTTESKFLDFNDLRKYGYEFMEYDCYYDFENSVPVKRALEGLCLDVKKKEEGGSNQAFQWEHENKTQVDGLPTHAYFIMILNPVDGVILSLGSYGAAYMGSRQNPPVTVLPKLKAYSDITYLQWAALHSNAATNIGNLKYIFRTSVENAATQSLVKQALYRNKKELTKWPGDAFYMDSDEGKALLGSPNGAGVACLLIQHKRSMGLKTIEKVIVFQDDGKAADRPPSLVYHVEDVLKGGRDWPN